MKLSFSTLLLALLICSGCATRYDMKLTDGMIITAKGKPRVDEKRHIIFFTDAAGQTNAIPEFKVAEIAPHSTMQEEDAPKKFNSVIKK